MILRDPGVEVESQNGSKIDPKMKLGWEGLLASIFGGLWSILEPKMGPSWHPKLIKNRSQKDFKKGMPKSTLWEASWRCPGASVWRLGVLLEVSWRAPEGGKEAREDSWNLLGALKGSWSPRGGGLPGDCRPQCGGLCWSLPSDGPLRADSFLWLRRPVSFLPRSHARPMCSPT